MFLTNLDCSQYFDSFARISLFLPIFRFFVKNFNVFAKFRFCVNISIFGQKFRCFLPNLDFFSQYFHFLSKKSMFLPKFQLKLFLKNLDFFFQYLDFLVKNFYFFVENRNFGQKSKFSPENLTWKMTPKTEILLFFGVKFQFWVSFFRIFSTKNRNFWQKIQILKKKSKFFKNNFNLNWL